jgi:hypothetical protein
MAVKTRLPAATAFRQLFIYQPTIYRRRIIFYR